MKARLYKNATGLSCQKRLFEFSLYNCDGPGTKMGLSMVGLSDMTMIPTARVTLATSFQYLRIIPSRM